MIIIPATLCAFAIVATLLPPAYYFLLVGWSTVCIASSKLPQITLNFSQKHTGVLSLITCLLQFVGGLARLGTLFQEVDDMLVIGNTSLATLLNFVLLLQVVAYASNTAKVLKQKKKTE